MTRRDKWKKRPCVVRYRAWADTVRAAKPEDFPNNPRTLNWTAYFPFPASYGKKKRQELAGRAHQQKPDRDNCDKGILDILFKNDAGIAFGTLCKLWDDGTGPRIEIEATP